MDGPRVPYGEKKMSKMSVHHPRYQLRNGAEERMESGHPRFHGLCFWYEETCFITKPSGFGITKAQEAVLWHLAGKAPVISIAHGKVVGPDSKGDSYRDFRATGMVIARVHLMGEVAPRSLKIYFGVALIHGINCTERVEGVEIVDL